MNSGQNFSGILNAITAVIVMGILPAIRWVIKNIIEEDRERLRRIEIKVENIEKQITKNKDRFKGGNIGH